MGLRHALKKGLSWGFAPKRWIGLDYVKSNSQVCSSLAKDIIHASKKKPADNTEPQDLESTKSRKGIAIVLMAAYLILSVFFVWYAGYMFFNKNYVFSGFVTLGIAGLLITYLVRELLIYAQLQLKRNKLTLKELVKHAIKGFKQ